MQSLIKRKRALMVASVGGSAFVLSGCDPTVRDTVLGGVENAATGLVSSLVSAFFESLTVPEEEPATVKLMQPQTLPAELMLSDSIIFV